MACIFNDFLKKNLRLKNGPIKTLAGEIIGEHQGLPLYTIGQRKGVEIGGRGPFYVVKKEFKTNALFVTNEAGEKALSAEFLLAENVNWISGQAPKMPLKCSAVIRYRQEAASCAVSRLSGKAAKIFKVSFAKPQRAITPGQSVVFYKGDELLGGGVISAAGR